MSVEDIHRGEQTLQSERPQDRAALQGFLIGAVISGLAVHEACRLAIIEVGWSGAATDAVTDLADSLIRTLSNGSLDFRLLLPEDEQLLEQRVAALSAWCRAFISGFGSSETGLERVREDELMLEWMTDLSYIAQGVAIEPSATEDADEKAYAEVVEYVTVGVQSLYGRICNAIIKTKGT